MINGAEPVLTEDLLVPYELEPYQPFRPFIHSYHITTTPRHHQGAQLGKLVRPMVHAYTLQQRANYRSGPLDH